VAKAPDPKKPKASPKVTFSRLLRLAKPERTSIILGTIFLLMGSAMNLAFPQGIRFIIDATGGKDVLEAERKVMESEAKLVALGADGPGLAQQQEETKQAQREYGAVAAQSTSTVDGAAIAMAVIFAVLGVSIASRYMLFSNAGERVVAKLRGDLFASLMSQEIAFYDSQKTGELTNRLSADTTVLQNTVSANISMALRNFVAVGGGMIFLFLTSPQLTALMLAIVPPVALGAVFYGRKVRKLSKDVQDALAKSSDVAEESLSGIRTVRSFAAEATELKRYRTAVSGSLALAFHRIRLSATFIGAASFAVGIAGVVVFWFGARMVIQRELTSGTLIVFLMYTVMVATSLGALSELWADFNRAAGAAERVFDLLERKPLITSGAGRMLPQLEGRVSWENVDFAYPTRLDMPVLRGFDLTLKPGEVVALVGPSGAGKSTIASLLYRLYDPQKGRVLLDGVPLSELDQDWLRQQIGVVAQEPLLFSTTVAENIRYGRPTATDDEIEAAARMANAHSFVSSFPEGYKTLVGERGVQLSGGQKQRVAIARAVLKNPKLLILDEATSALDAESEHLVREALERLMKGRTTLVIAHRLSTVQGADRVIVLDAGKVAQVGTHASLVIEDGIYKRLVERQFAAA
jgi:ABC transporter fused permease/ATP-binding protein